MHDERKYLAGGEKGESTARRKKGRSRPEKGAMFSRLFTDRGDVRQMVSRVLAALHVHFD